MSDLPESGVRELLQPDPSIYPLQYGVVYLNGHGDETTIHGPTKFHPGVGSGSNGWWRMSDGRYIGVGSQPMEPTWRDLIRRKVTDHTD